MPGPLLVLSLLAASEPVKLAAPGLSGSGLAPDRVTFFSEHLAQAMSSPQLRVVTQREIGALIGMERQKQLLGCNEDSASCMAELGAALGASGIVLGDIAKLGDKFQVNLKVMSTKDSTLLASRSARADNEVQLTDELSRMGRELAGEVLGAFGAPVPTVGAAPSRMRPVAWAPALAGLVVGLVGAGLLITSAGDANALRTQQLTYEQGAMLRERGGMLQILGLAGIGLGAAAIVAGAAIFIKGPSNSGVSAYLTATGTGFALGGGFP